MASAVRSIPTPKFSQGETVLCYEPDLTKSRVLYEAKVIEVDVTKDEKGKKVPEYFIHFNGWNKSWDRWVLEDQVLKNNDANKALKEKLHEQAFHFKKKRKQKVSATLSNKSDETASTCNAGKSDTEDIVDNPEQPKVEIEIPSQLKLKLEDDCYFIKRKKKLPRSPCVDEVVDEYYKHYMEANPEASGHLVKELMDGLKIYFNFTLPTLLLYNFEREQFRSIMQITSDNDVTINKTENGKTEEKCSIVSSTTENAMASDVSTSPKEKEKRSLRRRPLRSNPVQAEQQTSQTNQTSIENTEQTEPINQTNITLLEDTQSASVSSTSSPDASIKLSIKRKAKELEEESETSVENTPVAASASCPASPTSITAALLPASCKTLPSKIYGPEHLLRLFVKLPGLLGRTDMPEVNLTALLDHIDLFLRYLVEKFNVLFPADVYQSFL
ncbi:Male-specific lethal 3-like [Exaiptasia diaphana]|nr:Male-specific lethal 3-like [Exaiptasia diaphana]